MTEFIHDSSQPQFLPQEAVYFLQSQLESFESSRLRESRIGAAAMAALVEPERPDITSADPELETAFIGKLYDGLLVCLDTVNPVVLGKRHHSSEEKRMLDQATLYGDLLTVGYLSPHTLANLPLEEQPYVMYCQLLTEQVTSDLELLGYDSIDHIIQQLRTDESQNFYQNH